MVVLPLSPSNGFLAAARFWFIAERRGSDRIACAIMGFLLGPLALLLLLGEAAARRSAGQLPETARGAAR
jgi:hypothetical protein